MDRAEAMAQLQAAGANENDADRALDQAVIRSPRSARAGRSRVMWSESSGFTVMSLVTAEITPSALHAELPHALAVTAAVPGLLGFHPSSSLVFAGQTADRRPGVTLRYDLPDPLDPELASDMAIHAAAALTGNRMPVVTVVGFGSETLVVAPAVIAGQRLAAAGLQVAGLLRVRGGRYWCLCGAPGCEHGRPLPEQEPAAAVAGRPALPSRSALAATIAPLFGPEADTAGLAVQAAERAAAAGGRRQAERRGYTVAREAIARYRDGRPITDPAAIAELLVSLRFTVVRDLAWSLMDPSHAAAHERLWTDLTRRAPARCRPAPASLLAFTAWQRGNGALANVALDLALDADRRYSMAQLLHSALAAGAPPSLARLPLTPEQVTAAHESGPNQRAHAEPTELDGP